MGQKAERVTGLGRKKQEKDSKMESNDSPENPDRGETSDVPGFPSGSIRWSLFQIPHITSEDYNFHNATDFF